MKSRDYLEVNGCTLLVTNSDSTSGLNWDIFLDGTSIGTGKTRDEAVAEAIDTLNEAVKALRMPSLWKADDDV